MESSAFGARILILSQDHPSGATANGKPAGYYGLPRELQEFVTLQPDAGYDYPSRVVARVVVSPSLGSEISFLSTIHN